MLAIDCCDLVVHAVDGAEFRTVNELCTRALATFV